MIRRTFLARLAAVVGAIPFIGKPIEKASVATYRWWFDGKDLHSSLAIDGETVACYTHPTAPVQHFEPVIMAVDVKASKSNYEIVWFGWAEEASGFEVMDASKSTY